MFDGRGPGPRGNSRTTLVTRGSGRASEEVSGSARNEEPQCEAERKACHRPTQEQPLAPPSPGLSEEVVRFRRANLGGGHTFRRVLGCIEQADRHRTTMNSTMIAVNVDRSDPVPLHDQVAAEIRRAIAEGEAGPGDRLPLVKDLAAVLEVNKNTVLRALRTLRDEGLVEFGRGNGVTVVGTPQKGAVLARARDLVAFARSQGYRRDAVIAMIEALP